MSNVEKVSIALTFDMATIVREAVASGEYASSSEVVRDALRDWKIKRSLRQNEIMHLRLLWEEGLASGDGGVPDMNAIKQAARERLTKSNP